MSSSHQLDVLYVDNHLLVVNKAAGLLTQPSPECQESLEALAKAWIKAEYKKPGNVYLTAIHRLDRVASGAVLFAYTGGATLAAARAGANVCHLDASKKSVEWARGNARLNGLGDRPVRWITDDVIKFLKRELRRERQYDGFIMDPPNYGRGTKQEIFKIEEHLPEVLRLCKELMTPNPAFVILTCHAHNSAGP